MISPHPRTISETFDTETLLEIGRKIVDDIDAIVSEGTHIRMQRTTPEPIDAVRARP